MDKIKEFFKKHGKIVVIALLSCMLVSKCTTSCNRGMTIKKQSTEIAALDSTIAVRDSAIHDMMFTIEQLQNSLVSEKEHNSNFTVIATGNQTDLVNKITILQTENTKLKKQVSALQLRIDDLTKE